MGAYDLYDVHGDVPSRDWNGVGDWGIMASGNWNGGGLTPALPTASTLTIVDPLREITHFNPSVSSEYALSPFSQTGEIGSISISDTETIFVTFRIAQASIGAYPETAYSWNIKIGQTETMKIIC